MVGTSVVADAESGVGAGRPTPRNAATLTVSANERVAEGVVCLSLTHPDGARLPETRRRVPTSTWSCRTGRPGSFPCAATDGDANTYRIAVLREPAGRGGSAYLHDRLRAGDRVGVGGLRNHFPLVRSEKYLFIAGGITRPLPMVRQAERLGADRQLLYGGRTRASMASRKELTEACGERVHVIPQDDLGLLNLAAWLGAPRPDTRV